MKKKIVRDILVSTLFLIPFFSQGQQIKSLMQKLDSSSKQTHIAGGQINIIDRKAYDKNTSLNPHTYFILLASDIKQHVTSPFNLIKKDWIRVGKFALLTVALGFADEPIQKFIVKSRTNNKQINSVSKTVSNLGGPSEIYSLAALTAYGFITKDQKIKTTTLIASQAYITSGIMESLIKFLTGRERPSFSNPDSLEAEPTFHGPFNRSSKNQDGTRTTSAFPSGHATVAFAAATVYSMEFKNHRAVPIISYSVASLIALSRITENKHWATDVLAGSALGYVIGRQVVNNYHRFAKLKTGQQNQNTLSFNLQYFNGRLMPGLVYNF